VVILDPCRPVNVQQSLSFTCNKCCDFSNRRTTCTRQPASLYEPPVPGRYLRVLGRLWFLAFDDLSQHYNIISHVAVWYLASQHLEHAQNEQTSFGDKGKLLTCKVILPNEYMSHSELSEISLSSGASHNSAASHRTFPRMELVK
jgi:hypothetical protein